MFRTSIFLSTTLALANACSNSTAGPEDVAPDPDGGREVLRLAAASESCDNPVELCFFSDPPICDVYCEDQDQPDPEDCEEDGDGNVTCDDTSCPSLQEPDGTELAACPGSGCAVWLDAETGMTGIECNPGNDGDSGAGGAPGSSPGCSGDSDGNGVCDDDEREPPPPSNCPPGGDGSKECPFPL